METQLKKGILDVCVLAKLHAEDSYGYSLLQDISKIVEISESTLYPILRRLESQGSLTTYSVEYDGRLRKYYKITENGRQKVVNFLEEWKTVTEVYNFIKNCMEKKNG